MKAFNKEGEEIEVYSAEEHTAGIKTEVDKVTGEFTGKLTVAEQELKDAKTALGERAQEFGQFRKLNDDVVAKLTVAERTIYENGLLLEKNRVDAETRVKKEKDDAIDAVIAKKAGANEKLVQKMKDMWSVFGIEANTAEQMEQKSNMILGALSTSEPDLIASIGSFSGAAFIPKANEAAEPTFADSERGAAAANELGLLTKPPEKK